MANGSDWRARHRAQTPLNFDAGFKAKAIVALQGLNIDTVYERRKNWLSKRFAFLFDLHRSGAPPKLNTIHREQITIWAEKEALTATAIVARLKEKCNVNVSVGTVRNALKALGSIWKRTCHSSKKRNEVRFRQTELEIEELMEQAERGKITLACMDETGFALAQPNRST